MKKRGIILGLGLAGMAGLVVPPVQVSAANHTVVVGKEAIKENRPKKQKVIVQDLGGGHAVYGPRPGISPKYYGMFIVRPGTHKRTNK